MNDRERMPITIGCSVSSSKAVGGVGDAAGCLISAQRALTAVRYQLVEVGAGDILQHEEGAPLRNISIEDPHNIGVLHAPADAPLLQKQRARRLLLQEMGKQRLDDHQTFKPARSLTDGKEEVGHTARGELLGETIVAERLVENHGRPRACVALSDATPASLDCQSSPTRRRSSPSRPASPQPSSAAPTPSRWRRPPHA